AVLATTATLVAVFVPISFMPGVVGNLFSEFGFVLAFSVSISSIVALTVCPMLAAKLGSNTHPVDAPEGHPGLLLRMSNALGGLYARCLDICLRARWIVVLLCLGFAAAGWSAYKLLPNEITPNEDRGVLQIAMRAQQGVNLDYMSRL